MPIDPVAELQWEAVACEWCGASQGEFLFEGSDLQLGLPGRFRMVRCPQCGLIRQTPRLTWESLKHYYPEDFCSFAPTLDQQPSRLKRLDKRYGVWKLLRTMHRYQPGGRLLDVGCGTGVFLAEAQRTGRWDVVGIEPSRHAAAYARRATQAPIFEGRFSDVEAELSPVSFDVITMWHVLEHLPEPVADLRRAHRLLRPNGWLMMMIPNVESLAARVFGPYWLGWELPRHLYLFPRRTLDAILTSVGFRSADWRCLRGSYATLGYSLEFWSRAEGGHRWLAQMLVRAHRTLFARAALLVPLWVLDQLKLTTVITVFAQKASD